MRPDDQHTLQVGCEGEYTASECSDSHLRTHKSDTVHDHDPPAASLQAAVYEEGQCSQSHVCHWHDAPPQMKERAPCSVVPMRYFISTPFNIRKPRVVIDRHVIVFQEMLICLLFAEFFLNKCLIFKKACGYKNYSCYLSVVLQLHPPLNYM